MRAALLSAVLAMALAAPAMAQPPMGPQGDQGNWAGPHGMRWGEHDRGGDWARWGSRGPGGGWGPGEGRFHRLGEGAVFHFKRGKDEVDIRCPAHLPLQECVGAATTLLKALNEHGAPPAPGAQPAK